MFPDSQSLSSYSTSLLDNAHQKISAGVNNNVYTDLNQLKDIKLLANKDQNAAFKKIAQQFEGLFLQLMLKTMREANSAFVGEQSSEMSMHQSMFDNQLALNLSGDRGIGLADSFYEQMVTQYSGQAPSNPFKASQPKDTLIANNPYQDIQAIEKIQSNKSTVKANNTEALEINNFEPTSPTEFVQAIQAEAERVANKLGVDPKIIIAQSALETGWGKYIIADRVGRSSNNLFNIKADQRWAGRQVNLTTVEFNNGVAYKEKSSFRRYNNVHDSFTDYAQFILTEPRYKNARNSGNGQDYIRALHHSGYATDPNYATKVIELLDHEAIKNYGSLNKTKPPSLAIGENGTQG